MPSLFYLGKGPRPKTETERLKTKGQRGKLKHVWKSKFETAPLQFLRLHEAFQRVIPMETLSWMKDRSKGRDFNAPKREWKTKILLKGSF